MSWKNKVEFQAPSTKSVLAFMLLPQFKRMMPAFGHIGPIFVQTIALMFVQSGLLRPNHPATMYGAGPDVPKFRFTELLSEAWYNLRSGDGVTPYHYGLFFGVILMICLTITGLFLFIINLLMSTAQAQLFDHPSGASTGFDAVPTAANTGMFDTARNPENSDLAISILDKVLRQSYMGTGAPLQNALGPLIEFYNTALLVIAAIIVFWAIISIVIDTARTGSIGGQRASLVWLPIRFVFAMGLMIPLANGFNGGQAIVMKLAEWGSNLGSQGWSVYVQSVADESLAAQYDLEAIHGLAVGSTRIKLCEIAYNTILANGTQPSVNPNFGNNTLPSQNTVSGPYKVIPRTSDSLWGSAYRQATFRFGNLKDTSLCGTVSIPNPNFEPESLAGRVTEDGVVAGFVNWWSGEAPTTGVMTQYRKEVATAHRDGFYKLLSSSAQLACIYARENMNYPADTFYNPPSLPADTPLGAGQFDCSTAMPSCGVNSIAYGDGDLPDESCINFMVDAYDGYVSGIYDTARAEVIEHINGDFIEEVNARGWAAMGVWYHKIAQINSSLKAALDDFPTASSGTIDAQAINNLEESRDKAKARDETVLEVGQLLYKYDAWWGNVKPNIDAFKNANTLQSGAKIAETGKFGELLNYVFSSVVGGDGTLIYKMEGTGANTYPLAQLAAIGDAIINKSMVIYGVILALTGVGLSGDIPVLGWVTGAANVILDSPIGDLMGTLAMAGLAAGMVLKYYVPLVPWIRVTFAVLAWIVSVVEAIVVIPLLALANLNLEGDGLLSANAKNMYQLALNLLMRPIMVVIGYVLGMLIFNAMVLYVNDTFQASLVSLIGSNGPNIFGQIAFTIIYVFVVYSLANSTFKLVDTIPNALMKWMGGPQDQDFQDSQAEGYIAAIGSMAGNMDVKASGLRHNQNTNKGNPPPKDPGTNA